MSDDPHFKACRSKSPRGGVPCIPVEVSSVNVVDLPDRDVIVIEFVGTEDGMRIVPLALDETNCNRLLKAIPDLLAWHKALRTNFN